MHKTLIAIVSSSAALLIACASPDPSGVPMPGETAKSDKARNENPAVADDDVLALAAANRDFAFDLYRSVRAQEDGNFFFSPHSISVALGMTWGGARSITEEEMANTLHFTLGQETTHPAFNALDLALDSRGEGAAGADGEGFRLNVLNQTWGQVGYEFLPDYLDLLAEHYGAGLQLMDFRADPELAREEINAWVEAATEGHIEDLLPQGTIKPSTTLVLTNAIYFNAAWEQTFDPDATHDGTFHRKDGTTSTVPLMVTEGSFGFASGSGWEALDLPYDGGELSMVMIVPESGAFDSFEASLDGATVADVLDQLQPGHLQVTIPKFGDRTRIDLKRHLSEMGMPSAFTEGQADFSGIDGTRELVITDVLHQAFVNVTEAGTEAAGATGVVVGPTSVPQQVIVDRPFIYLIRDIETGAILFTGRVLDPAS